MADGAVEPDPARAKITARLAFWAQATEVLRDRIMDADAGDYQQQLDATLLAVAIRNILRAADWAETL
jgi:hypothetical protein